ncbi:MAG: hypothetical protein IJX17_03550 [Clostridia bacterium]|nr:hypothetical protein [Clostridia bacterium]
MAKIDLHKLALAVGFEVICVEDDSINYEYMVRIRDIESISYVLKLKNNPDYSEVDNIIASIIIVLPNKLKRKVKKLMKKRDKDNIDNIIDLLCYTVTEFKSKTKYSLLKEYGNLVGVNIEEYGFFFKYKLPKKEFIKIKSLVESKLSIEDAPIVGKIKGLEHKMAYIKQKQNSNENQSM